MFETQRVNGLFIGALASICAFAYMQSDRRDEIHALQERVQVLEEEREHLLVDERVQAMVERKCNNALKLKMEEVEAFTQESFDRLQTSMRNFTELYELLLKKIEDNQNTGKRRSDMDSEQPRRLVKRSDDRHIKTNSLQSLQNP